MKSRIGSLLALGILTAISAAASVVVDSNVWLNPGTFYPPANYAITVSQSESVVDPTTLWFSKQNLPGNQGSKLQAVTWNIDEEADYYLVQYGQEFSASTIASGIFQPFFVLDSPYSITVPFGRFYLGINTGRGFKAEAQPNRDIFGWAELLNTTSGLQLLHSAMAYDEHGIVIGTSDTVAIPEPNTAALCLGAACAAFVWARRYRQPAG